MVGTMVSLMDEELAVMKETQSAHWMDMRMGFLTDLSWAEQKVPMLANLMVVMSGIVTVAKKAVQTVDQWVMMRDV